MGYTTLESKGEREHAAMYISVAGKETKCDLAL